MAENKIQNDETLLKQHLKEQLQSCLGTLMLERQDQKLTDKEEKQLTRMISSLDKLLERFVNRFPFHITISKATEAIEEYPHAGRFLPLYLGMHLLKNQPAFQTEEPHTEPQTEPQVREELEIV